MRCEGIPFGPKPKLTPSRVEYAIDLPDNGKSLAAVARLLGVERIPPLARDHAGRISRGLTCYKHKKLHVDTEFVVWCVTLFVVYLWLLKPVSQEKRGGILWNRSAMMLA